MKNWTRADSLSLSLCLLAGLTMALLPNILSWIFLGNPIWIQDGDMLLYLSIASKAYHNNPFILSDVTFIEPRPVHYPSLQFVPAVLAAKIFGLGPLGIDFAWKVWAGFSTPLIFYFFLRHFIQRPYVILLLVVLFITDINFFWGKPVVRQAYTLYETLKVFNGMESAYTMFGFDSFRFWRIITPGLSMFYFVLYLWQLVRALEAPSPRRILFSGLSFGLLFYAYFYFWTGAALGIALGVIFDSEKRRTYLHTLWVGSLVGSPMLLYSHFLLKDTNPDWMPRMDLLLPVDRWREFQFPFLSFALMLVATIWAAKKHRKLMFLGYSAIAGLILINHQIFTGRAIMNFHWNYVLGSSLSLLLVLLVYDYVSTRVWPSWAKASLALVLLFSITTGIFVRVIDTFWEEESRLPVELYSKYVDQSSRPSRSSLKSNSVMAGDSSYISFFIMFEQQRPLYYFAVFFSPSVDNDEMDYRVSLQWYLSGLSRVEFLSFQRNDLGFGTWGPWRRNPALLEETVQRRLEIFDEISKNPEPLLERFGVRYLALDKDDTPPKYVAENWKEIEAGPYWKTWERP